MKTLITAILSTALVACGGGSDDPSHSVTYTIPATVNQYVRDLPSGTYNDPPNTVGQWSLTVRHMGANPYELPISKFSARNHYKSLIDSSDRAYVPVVGGGPHSIITYMSNDDISCLTFSGDMTYTHAGEGVSQMSLFMYVQDSAKTGAIVLNLKDNRFSTYEPFVGNDTFTAFISIPPVHTKYADTVVTSTGFRTVVDMQNWKEILNALGMSHSSKIISYGMIHEIFYTNGNRVVSNVSVENFVITRN